MTDHKETRITPGPSVNVKVAGTDNQKVV
jgi:hypothetical protein